MEPSYLQILRKITPTEQMPYFEKGLHLWVEKMDSDNNMDAINAWVIKDSANERFLHYWIEKTTPVFGKWNWAKQKQ